MHDKLVIIGASGHGKVAADIAMRMKKWKEIVFLDDDDSIKRIMDFEIIGLVKSFLKYKQEADFFVAIGNNSTREKIQSELISHNCSIATLVHPNSTIGLDVQIGIGTIIMAGVVINSSTKVGVGCIINTSSSIDHDNVIEDYVHISPGSRTGVFCNRKVHSIATKSTQCCHPIFSI